MIPFRFILADLRRLWVGSLVVVLLIAGATALGMAVNLQERALRLGSARAAERFDLVIGAAGSDTQLVLSAVFLQPSPLTLLPGSVLQALTTDPRVAMAAPVGFGDSFDGMPVVGTTAAFVLDNGRETLLEGRAFDAVPEAVIGANVPLAIGDQVKPLHGLPGEGGHTHGELSYSVVGRMRETGTPWDRAILVPIEGVWRIHHLGEGHEGASVSEHADAADHDHEHDADDAEAHGAGRIGPPWVNPPGIPAIIVKAKTIADAYRLRSEYRKDTTLGVFPAEVLTRLFSTLGDVRKVLSVIAMATQALVAAAIVLVCVVHLAQRRRQLAALRALGAPRSAIFALVWSELLALVAVGVASGVALGYVGARVFAQWLSQASGIVGPVMLTMQDVWLAFGLLAIAAIMATIPGVMAYRQSTAVALRA
ncbi:ABC transporter permease [Microvirga puerhi]|uniref:ABC transporter permease n=1 Tax=Microvirga puerhi TaxID=2876078 RepID=A0ABS7VIN7_9HYPH|nr:ABC transporter permease [Microvirga puerhi]MBZ6074843.1 ABC transporter permease [Microvirga puerhi]